MKQAIVTLCQSEHHPGNCPTQDDTKAKEFDTRTVEIRVIVYNNGRFVLRDADGRIVIEIEGRGRERGRTAKETLNVERVSIEAVHPDDIEVFINDRQLPADAIFNERQPKVFLDLSEHAE